MHDTLPIILVTCIALVAAYWLKQDIEGGQDNG